MAQTPARTATNPRDGARRDAPPPPLSPDASLNAHPPAAALIADPDDMRASVNRTRLCVLCGRPLRAGQHMLRIHGSTIHARCSNTSHDG